MSRKAMSKQTWELVRKDVGSVAKGDVTSGAGGAAVPAQGIMSERSYPGQRNKVPPVKDVNRVEEISLPRKFEDPTLASPVDPALTGSGVPACACDDKKKCACQKTDEVSPGVTLADKPIDEKVSKPLPKPHSGQGKDAFVSSCMGDDKMVSEFPDQRQRAAVCYSQSGEKKQKASPNEDFDASAEVDFPGMCLMLESPRELSDKIKQDGGEAPDDMHATLGYYGKVGKDVPAEAVDTVKKCVAMSAEGYHPIKAKVGGVGRFNASNTSDGKDVLFAHVDSPDLHPMREHLIENVRKCGGGIAKAADGNTGTNQVGEPTPGVPDVRTALRDELKNFQPKTGFLPKTDHGYTPHITLAYIDQDAPMPIHKLPSHEFTFTHLVLAVGKERHRFKLGEKANVRKDMWCPIVKADDTERLATGIVLQPEIVDAQGDIISEEVIKETAHNFLAMYNKKTQMGLQHEVMQPQGVELVESWIAPVDMMLNNRTILKGTWMMTVRVLNDAIWTGIKAGVLNGFSIGGVAKVQKLLNT